MKLLGVAELAAALVLILLSIWSISWVFSSAELAHETCSGSYSLFHELPRCRQPYNAMILFLAALVAAMPMGAIGVLHLQMKSDK